MQVRGRVGSRWLLPITVKNQLTKFLLQTKHRSLGHAETSTIISILGQHHYILGVKLELKGIARKCMTCQQVNANTSHQQMGMQPTCRTELQPPSHLRLDFNGEPTEWLGFKALFTAANEQDRASGQPLLLLILRKTAKNSSVSRLLHTSMCTAFVAMHTKMHK